MPCRCHWMKPTNLIIINPIARNKWLSMYETSEGNLWEHLFMRRTTINGISKLTHSTYSTFANHWLEFWFQFITMSLFHGSYIFSFSISFKTIQTCGSRRMNRLKCDRNIIAQMFQFNCCTSSVNFSNLHSTRPI